MFDCRGIDCDIYNRCNECVNIQSNVMIAYIMHKTRLKSKHKVKEPLLSGSVVVQSNVSDAPSSIDVRQLVFFPQVINYYWFLIFIGTTGRPSLVRQSVIRNNQLFGIIFSTGR